MAVGAITALAGSALGALGNQSRSLAAGTRHVDQSTVGIAGARDKNTAREARKNAQAERLVALATDPQVMGMLTVFGGLFLANKIPWAEDPGINRRISGIAAAAAVLMGLGRAGVGDLTTLGVAAAAGVATGFGGSGANDELIPDSGVPWYLTGSPLAGPLYIKHKYFDD